MVERIADFLREIGLEVRARQVPEGTFLPGIEVAEGRIAYDPATLRFPGDLLHEAGHLAVLAPDERVRFGTDDEHLDMQRVELRAIAWSHAAGVRLDLTPDVVFHAGGYGGRGAALAFTYANGVYPGAAALEELGLTATGERAHAAGVDPYPQMLRWLRA